MNIGLLDKTVSSLKDTRRAERDNEIKFIISNSRSNQILSWLRAACVKDGSYPAAIVSSIYFDTLQWKHLHEKINSYYLKTKVRIRWYSDFAYRNHSSNSYLEVKFKIGSKREKIRIKTDISGNELASTPLEDPSLISIPYTIKSLGADLNYPLIPAFQISYKRERFIDPMSGSRICFDYDISSLRTNSQMLACTNKSFLETAVFEIKGSREELPASLYPVTQMGCQKSSFSKYLSCYQKINNLIL